MAFSSKLKQKKCHKIFKKAIHKTNLQKTSKFKLKQAQKQATRKSSKKTPLHKKTSPNSQENHKVGNTVILPSNSMITQLQKLWVLYYIPTHCS